MASVPDIVRIAELDTEFFPDENLTKHFHHVSKPGKRRVVQEEMWKRRRELGRGAFGAVHLEICIKGEKEGNVRAVKEIKKSGDSNYNRELEAIALFSQPKYESSFVKSFGWYANNDRIFITMQYLPNGDLQQYLGSPLPEYEGQKIIYQILEGLSFMHESKFAHRDLKPANILVVEKGPDWWIKIADFGISKRATEGLTALRTRTGTPKFAAPEVLGYGQIDDPKYRKTPFTDLIHLSQYASRIVEFPVESLEKCSVSETGCSLVKTLIAPKPQDRPTAKNSLQDQWFSTLDEATFLEPKGPIDRFDNSTLDEARYLNLGSSASWSSHEGNSKSNTAYPPRYEPSKSWETQVPDLTQTSSKLTNTAVSAEVDTLPSIGLPASSAVYTEIDWKGSKRLEGHSGPVCSVAFSPDGKLVASGSRDSMVQLWDVATGKQAKQLKGHKGAVYAVAFSPDSKLIASGSFDCTLRLWDVVSGKGIEHSLEQYGTTIQDVVFSPDGKLVALGASDEVLRLWHVRNGKIAKQIDVGSGVPCIAFSPDSKLVAFGTFKGVIGVQIWDTATGRSVKRFEGRWEYILSVNFSLDGRLLVSGSHEGKIQVGDAITEKETIRTVGQNVRNEVTSVALSPNGKLIILASYSDRIVQLRDIATGQEIRRLDEHRMGVLSVAYSPDGRLVASGSYDDTVRLWDLSEST